MPIFLNPLMIFLAVNEFSYGHFDNSAISLMEILKPGFTNIQSFWLAPRRFLNGKSRWLIWLSIIYRMGFSFEHLTNEWKCCSDLKKFVPVIQPDSCGAAYWTVHAMQPTGPFSNITGATFFLGKINTGGALPPPAFMKPSIVTLMPRWAETVCCTC